MLFSFMQGAFWSLMAGLLVGVIRMILDFVYPAPLCGEIDSRPGVVKFHYLYFASFLFAFTAVFAVVVSYLTPPIEPKHVSINLHDFIACTHVRNKCRHCSHCALYVLRVSSIT